MEEKNKKEKTVKAYGRSLPISTRQSIEICSYIRGKNINKAISSLKRVIEMKEAVPFTRFNKDMGHKPGIGPGRYPQKSTEEIIRLLESAKANAQAKNLDVENLIISSIIANKASSPWRAGRQKRRKAKRTHIEIIIEEKADLKKKGKKSEKKEEKTESVHEKPKKEKQKKSEEKVKTE